MSEIWSAAIFHRAAVARGAMRWAFNKGDAVSPGGKSHEAYHAKKTAMAITTRTFSPKWVPLAYVFLSGLVMLGYVRYDPYQVDGDAVSYMDIASNILHGRWHTIPNGLWNPGYPALLAIGKLIIHPDRVHELQVFYWVNFVIFCFSLACASFFVRSIVVARNAANNASTSTPRWLLSNPFLYVTAYAIVFLSWQYEFSVGKIRVDGLFASLLLLAFGCVFRFSVNKSICPAIGIGFSFALAYLVKSPGFVIAVVSYILLAGYLILESQFRIKGYRLLISFVVFALVVGPYIGALSWQKRRFDFGDSGRLNYAWSVSGTDALHLLNGQPARDGNASVYLKHPQIQLLANPGVVFFPEFPYATYSPWFDPSYYNEGVVPRFNIKLQIHSVLQQLRRFWIFVVVHSLVLALLAICIAVKSKMPRLKRISGMLVLVCGVAVFCFIMYLCVLFRDRYVAGLFWVACISVFGMLESRSEFDRSMIEGSALFMAIAILLMGARSVAQMRQSVIFRGVKYGWYNSEEFDAAKTLNQVGILPGRNVACFRACNTGAYWARLAGVHVVSEIFDPKYIRDTGDGEKMWQSLPNKSAVIDALAHSGASVLVGYFEVPPESHDSWRLLAGHYYWMPLY